MAACKFNIPLTKAPEEFAAKAKKGITGAGGIFNGNALNGAFEMPTPVGAIKGNYTVNNSIIKILIEDKPFFISCKKIQEELEKQL